MIDDQIYQDTIYQGVTDMLYRNRGLSLSQLENRLMKDLGCERYHIKKACLDLLRVKYLTRSEEGDLLLTGKGEQAGTLPKSGSDSHIATMQGNGAPALKYKICDEASPRKSSFRLRLWRAMGVRDKFTLWDLLSVAIRGDEKNPRDNAGKYIRVLVRSGYLRKLPRKREGKACYLRLKHTGPQNPQERVRSKELFDPNNGEIFSWGS